MNLSSIIQTISGQVFHRASDFADVAIKRFLAGDLMSDILTQEGEHSVLVTSLATDHAARTADFVGARAIILVNGKKPCESLLELAKTGDISIITTAKPLFETCTILGSAMEKN